MSVQHVSLEITLYLPPVHANRTSVHGLFPTFNFLVFPQVPYVFVGSLACRANVTECGG